MISDKGPKFLRSKKLRKIVDILLDFRGKKIEEYCYKRLKDGVNPYDIFYELSQGLEEIGRGYEDEKFKRYFTSDLIVSGRNMRKAIEIIRPHIKENIVAKGKVVLGTVKGDVHDIGKKIFGITLESHGFEVIDIGVDVDKEVFARKVKELKPDILGMSSLLTSTVSYMKEVIKELERRGLRGKVKVIVGGRAVTEDFAKMIGADAYGKDSVDGFKKCLKFMEEKR
jgi:methylmalonyl-CoA mutase cobalamin-binding domain/chain